MGVEQCREQSWFEHRFGMGPPGNFKQVLMGWLGLGLEKANIEIDVIKSQRSNLTHNVKSRAVSPTALFNGSSHSAAPIGNETFTQTPHHYRDE